MIQLNALKQIIQDEKQISVTDLVMKSSVSISVYNKFRPYLAKIFEGQVKYDHPYWIWIGEGSQ